MIPSKLKELLLFLKTYNIYETEAELKTNFYKITVTNDNVSPNYNNYSFELQMILTKGDTQKLFFDGKELLHKFKMNFGVISKSHIPVDASAGDILTSLILTQSLSI